MTILKARLHAVGLDTFEIQCPEKTNFRLGQYFLASTGDMPDILPAALFPRVGVGRRLVVDGPVLDGWQIGMALNMRGPLGRGFHIPAAARKIAIVDFANPARSTSFFLPWMETFCAAGGELVYFSERLPGGLPNAVEGLLLEQAGEAWRWAEYLAADVGLADVERLLKILAGGSAARLPDQAEVLVRTEMPCGGPAECGLCAVKTARGYRLACKHGPVFPLAELTREAR